MKFSIVKIYRYNRALSTVCYKSLGYIIHFKYIIITFADY